MNKIFTNISKFINSSTIEKFSKKQAILILEKIDTKYNNSLLNRSKKQYLSHKFLQKKRTFVILNLFSFFIFPFFIFILFLLFIKSLFAKKQKTDAQLSISILKTPIYFSLQEKYIIKNSNSHYINFKDLRYIFKIMFLFKFSPFFLLKFFIRISQYSYAFNSAGASAIITSFEYSYLSSALTDYCHYYNKKHINVMHGEKLFFIRDSFFQFDKTYIWDEHYSKLFRSLKAEKNQFVCELPTTFQELLNKKNNLSNKTIIKYYLDGSETKKQLLLIKNILEKKYNKDIIFRPHPLYSKHAELDLFDIKIEKNINIIDSIAEASIIVSKYSTVLFQASLINKQIIIDNISNPEVFNFLSEADYIMLKKNHIKLSEL